MFDRLKKELYFNKMGLLFNKGKENGSIVPFDDEFYEKMSHTYISCIPVSLNIKYLKPTFGPEKCYDRSLEMFFCFENALLVRGDNKDLELKYGKENAGHGWIEIGDYVYDPSLLLRFEKDVYYELYCPTNVSKYSKDDYIRDRENKDFYEEIKTTTLQDFQPNGRKRIDLCLTIPLVKGIAEMGTNEEFKKELNDYLKLIQYDERQVFEEFNNSFNTFIKQMGSR